MRTEEELRDVLLDYRRDTICSFFDLLWLLDEPEEEKTSQKAQRKVKTQNEEARQSHPGLETHPNERDAEFDRKSRCNPQRESKSSQTGKKGWVRRLFG